MFNFLILIYHIYAIGMIDDLINFTPAVSAAVPYFCHSGLSRIFLAIPNKSEGFPTSGNDTENKYSISDALRSLPQGTSQLFGRKLVKKGYATIFRFRP